jgi:hypothetical protein
MNPGTVLLIALGVIGLLLYVLQSLKSQTKEHFAVVDEDQISNRAATTMAALNSTGANLNELFGTPDLTTPASAATAVTPVSAGTPLKKADIPTGTCGSSPNAVFNPNEVVPTGPLMFCNPSNPAFYKELARIKGTDQTDPAAFKIKLPNGKYPLAKLKPGTPAYNEAMIKIGFVVDTKGDAGRVFGGLRPGPLGFVGLNPDNWVVVEKKAPPPPDTALPVMTPQPTSDGKKGKTISDAQGALLKKPSAGNAAPFDKKGGKQAAAGKGAAGKKAAVKGVAGKKAAVKGPAVKGSPLSKISGNKIYVPNVCPPMPDLSDYIRKDSIPCYGCNLK